MTFCGIPFVFPEKVTQDCRVRRIGRQDSLAAVNEAMCLVIVHRLDDVGWNQPIILKRFCNAINLYR
jgi:hypothetical protein